MPEHPKDSDPEAAPSDAKPRHERHEVERFERIPGPIRAALRASSRGDRELAAKHGMGARKHDPAPAEPLDPKEQALADALAEHGTLNRAALACGIAERTATRMVQRSPALASAVARGRYAAALHLESVAWAVAAGDKPAEEVELVTIDEDGNERVAWKRRTYRRDPRLLELLLRQHGGPAWKAKDAGGDVQVHRKRIVLELEESSPSGRVLESGEPEE
jgi:hypothetical protein